MLFSSATTQESNVKDALSSLVDQVKAQFGDGKLDLLAVFLSVHFTNRVREIMHGLSAMLEPATMLGCTADGVIGREQEIENQPAVTLLAGRLPGVILEPFALQPGETDWHKILLDKDEFLRMVGADADTKLFLMLGDPFSTPMSDVLQAFNENFTGVPVVGGMASAALRPEGNSLFLNDTLTHQGVLGVAFSGRLEVEVVVSQGSRPFGRPFKVFEARRNRIYSLEGRTPLDWLEELLPMLSEEERSLLQSGLFVGRSIRSDDQEVGRGDFLIWGVVDIDPENGSIAISDSVMEGDTVQFHLRDAVTAQEDLEMMLVPQVFRDPPRGGLVFSCNGRGRHLYEQPNVDISVIQNNLDNTHLAGFFCAGEIGPIGSENFLHGQTISLVMFREPED